MGTCCKTYIKRDTCCISPSGYMHYVTCIGNRYMLLKTYTGHILYHLWLMTACIVHIGTYIISAHLAVCIMQPVLGTGTFCKTYIETYYITSDYMTACIIHIGTYINISPSGCVHYVACIGKTGTFCNLCRHSNICEYMIACNVHIATYIFISFRLAVCIM